MIKDGSNADVACDSYHKYARDVEMLAELEVKFYRFSLSWSRILPSGFDNKISVDGVAYYNNLINLLIMNNITPVVTIYHWDLPQSLQDLGGWANPLMETYFKDYARVVFDNFGDRVQQWLTFNEPFEVCESGYGFGSKAPVIESMGVGDYLCSHTLLKAHASVYHLYDDVYRPIQNGRIGMTISAAWYEPEIPNSPESEEASNYGLQFTIGWHAHPIFSAEGDYPSLMKERIAKRSEEQGFSYSRLPAFTPEEVEYIKGTSDFLGINHYTSVVARHASGSDFPIPSYEDDMNVIEIQPDEWPSAPESSWLKIVPWGFTKILVWLKNEYNDPEIIIFENGYSDQGGTDDQGRIDYFHLYLNAMLDAMEQGVSVSAYTAWSLMDNFELTSGYTDKFGLYQVDFNDPERTRTPKASAKYYTELIRTRTLLRA